MQRRLAAIMVADVVGSSRLIEADEAGALSAMRERWSGIVEPLVKEHVGRVVKYTGDGVLADFASAVKAVACGLAIQERMAKANEGIDEGRRVALRIGINVGDIVDDGSDIFGDGVNVAARIEAFAEPGGLCVTGNVHEAIRGKLVVPMEDLGEKELKNIGRPVRLWRTGAKDAAAILPPVKRTDPSIAVLPFQNMSGDPAQDFFTDGLTEDIITDLTNVPGFLVIARNSTFAYKGKPVDVRQIAKELGVKYVLEGSARRASQRLRVNIQLIDAAGGGAHLFAERFDSEIADVFVVQDEITRRVVERISGRLAASSVGGRQRPKSLEAYEMYMLSRSIAAESSKAANEEICRLLERAVEFDPDYSTAHWRLATVLTSSWMIWGDPPDKWRPAALLHARKAVTCDPMDARAHAALGFVLAYERRWDEAEPHFDTALRLNPNDADVLIYASDFRVLTGEPEVAIQLAERALRLDPHAPSHFYWLLGQAQVAAGRYEEAVATLRHEKTYASTSRRDLCVALVKLGRLDEAKAEAQAFVSAYPEWRIETDFELEAALKNPEDKKFWVEGYLEAGLPR